MGGGINGGAGGTLLGGVGGGEGAAGSSGSSSISPDGGLIRPDAASPDAEPIQPDAGSPDGRKPAPPSDATSTTQPRRQGCSCNLGQIAPGTPGLPFVLLGIAVAAPAPKSIAGISRRSHREPGTTARARKSRQEPSAQACCANAIEEAWMRGGRVPGRFPDAQKTPSIFLWSARPDGPIRSSVTSRGPEGFAHPAACREPTRWQAL
jgi:hypothetical protein